jgi:hypothetical protein
LTGPVPVENRRLGGWGLFMNVPKRSKTTGKKKTFLPVPLKKKEKSGIPFRPLGVPSPTFSEFGRKKESSALMG